LGLPLRLAAAAVNLLRAKTNPTGLFLLILFSLFSKMLPAIVAGGVLVAVFNVRV